MGAILIDHMGISVTNLTKSKAFYSKILVPLGYVLITEKASSISFGVKGGNGKNTDPGGEFWISAGIPMVPPVHFAFRAASRIAVDAFFTAGVLAGGTDNGAPGFRAQYHATYYAAFLLDPDGYPIEAVCHSKAA